MGNVSLVVVGLVVVLGGCMPSTSFLVTPVSGTRALREKVVRREALVTFEKIALIEVEGILQYGNDRESLTGLPLENPVAIFKERLDKAARDRAVKAVVLRMNTPGGGVTASDIMYTEVLKFKARTGKPVVTCMIDIGASGGYYIACAGDHIIAHPTTVTGSIGVITMIPNVSDTLAKIGARVHAFKSGQLKDAGSPFRPMDPAAETLYQQLVEDLYARFVAVVDRGRPQLSRTQVEQVADGRVFLGPDALELGLVDALGTVEDSIVAAKEFAGVGTRPVLVVQYARPYAHRPNFYAQDAAPARATASALPLQLLPPWLRHSTPQMLYMWAPGW